jgi:PST family polysaccharide transporter
MVKLPGSQLRANIFALSVLQFSNYLVPLIVLPYLVRVLGPESYGLTTFTQAFIAHFILIVDFGFNLSGTKQISINRNDPKALREDVSTIFFLRLILLSLSAGLVFGISGFVPELQGHDDLLWITFLTVFGQALFPQWYFLGLEKMRWIALISLVPRLATIPLYFVLVTSPDDFIVSQSIASAGIVVSGLLGASIMLAQVGLTRVSLGRLWATLSSSWLLFVAQLGTTVYTTSAGFFLGLTASHESVGYFVGAWKIVNAIQGLFAPVWQSVFPRLASMASVAPDEALERIRRLLKWVFWSGLGLTLIVLVFAELVVRLLLGPQFEASVPVLRILAPLPLLIGLSSVMGIQTLIPLNRHVEFSVILCGSAVIFLSLVFPLAGLWQESGAAIAVVISEVVTCLAMWIVVRRMFSRTASERGTGR